MKFAFYELCDVYPIFNEERVLSKTLTVSISNKTYTTLHTCNQCHPWEGVRAECIFSRVTLTNVLLNNGSSRIYVKPTCQNFSLKDKVLSISARLNRVILISKRGIKRNLSKTLG